MPTSIGLDIGGTNISAAICDEHGDIIYSCKRKSDYLGDQYIENIDDMIETLIKQSRIDICGIGVGVPGTVDYDTGKVVVCPAFDWKDVYLKDHIERRFGIRAFVDNDVNAWTIAEKYLGAARQSGDFAMVTIGTGIGCGLYLDGKIYRGHSYEAGEIGYLPLSVDAYQESFCKNEFGYFENKASASAAGRIYQSITDKQLDCKDIFIQAKQGNRAAKKVVTDVYRYLGLGISSLFCILNPEIVVIGGGMAEEGQEFLEEVTRNVTRLIPLKVKLSLSKTGAYGGAVGSALSVFYTNHSKDSERTNLI